MSITIVINKPAHITEQNHNPQLISTLRETNRDSGNEPRRKKRKKKENYLTNRTTVKLNMLPCEYIYQLSRRPYRLKKTHNAVYKQTNNAEIKNTQPKTNPKLKQIVQNRIEAEKPMSTYYVTSNV